MKKNDFYLCVRVDRRKYPEIPTNNYLGQPEPIRKIEGGRNVAEEVMRLSQIDFDKRDWGCDFPMSILPYSSFDGFHPVVENDIYSREKYCSDFNPGSPVSPIMVMITRIVKCAHDEILQRAT